MAAAFFFSGGCAYFHPAFITDPSPPPTAMDNSVVVCERTALSRSRCARMSRTELDAQVAEALRRDWRGRDEYR